jgi:hypothetical protein
MRLAAAVAAVLSPLSVGVAACSASGQTQQVATGEPPPIVKTCGQISTLGRTLDVDIAEGRMPIKCRRARHVMKVYLARSKGAKGTRRVKVGSKVWDCYGSRPDGVGWDFHCSWQRVRKPYIENYVDIGAGRRFWPRNRGGRSAHSFSQPVEQA